MPAEIPLAQAARLLNGVKNIQDLEQVIGPALYREAITDKLLRLDQLTNELKDTERLAEPLRRELQSGDSQSREKVLALMRKTGLTESDLGTAWHHVPDDRRAEVREMFRSLILS